MDTYREVASADAYRASMLLSREGLIAGPSSGQALRGLLDHVGALKEGGRLDELRGGKEAGVGEVNCVFTCSDLPYQYLDGYFAKLGEDEFPRIENEVRGPARRERERRGGRERKKEQLAMTLFTRKNDEANGGAV